MPLYEFHCEQCDEEFEELLSPHDDEEDVECPSCGSGDVRKLLSGFTMSSSQGAPGAGASSCSPRGPFR